MDFYSSLWCTFCASDYYFLFCGVSVGRCFSKCLSQYEELIDPLLLPLSQQLLEGTQGILVARDVSQLLDVAEVKQR